MQIETYEIEETTAGEAGDVASAADTEAIALIDKLGLKGQRSLIVPAAREDGEVVETRIPYPEMSAHEKAVYSAIFPQATPVADYAAGIIPVRVLQVVGHATGLFEKVEVWHKKMRDPDPVLVGCIGTTRFLLARWGDALRPFAELVEEARVAIRLYVKEKLEESISTAQVQLTGLEGFVSKRLHGEWIPIY